MDLNDFPVGYDRLSLWDIACRITGQDWRDSSPTTETRDVLACLIDQAYPPGRPIVTLADGTDVATNRGEPVLLWIEFDLVIDGKLAVDAFVDSMRVRGGRSDDLDWRHFQHIFVHRASWDRYRAARMAPQSSGALVLGTVATDEQAATDVRRAAAPRLQLGSNSRANVEAFIVHQAMILVEKGDTKSVLAEKVRRAIPSGSRSDRREITVASIIRMLPPGITGGRARNGGK